MLPLHCCNLVFPLKEYQRPTETLANIDYAMDHNHSMKCSTIDTAMAKYRNDIGYRLSDSPLAIPSTADFSDYLSQHFYFLTIDTRKANNSKQNKITKSATDSRLKEADPVKATDPASAASTPTTIKSPKVISSSSRNSQQENIPSRKMCLKDRLARALFHKRHVCCRCKRRSRSCIRNKTFNGIEKRYTCASCREVSIAVRNLFNGHSNSNDTDNSNSSSSHLQTLECIKSAKQNSPEYKNDSGYETVTSCSTVASTCSAFTSSANTSPICNTDSVAVKSAINETLDHGSSKNSNMAQSKELKRTAEKEVRRGPYTSANHTTRVNESGIFNFISKDQQQSSAGVLRQVTRRNVNDYDGYLPGEYHHENLYQNPTYHVLTDATNIAGSHGNSLGYNESRLIRLDKSGISSTLRENACYTCGSVHSVFFKLPWDGAWICEDCLDRLY